MKLDEEIESDFSGDDEQHSNLVNAVSQLDSSRRVKAPTRKELSSVVSEFHLPKGTTKDGDLVNVNELADVLRSKSAVLSQKVRTVTRKAKTLSKPLEKPVAERIKRKIGYQNVTNQLKKWNAIVEKNKVADQLSFPLRQGNVTLQTSHQFLSKFKQKTPLEIEMSKILKGEEEEKAILEEMEKEKEKNLKFPLTLEEIMEKRKEMAQFRAKLSYREAKAHRQSKIKSKKYHRILKREKVKQQLKDFEQLQKSDPEAALKKLEELDKTRAQERASLRHKNTGKWARNLAVRAKYDQESRKVLAEQLKLSRDLTEKVKKRDGEEDSSGNEEENFAEVDQSQNVSEIISDNPWAVNVSSEVKDFVSGYKKYWETKNKEKEKSVKDIEGLRVSCKSDWELGSVAVGEGSGNEEVVDVGSLKEVTDQKVVSKVNGNVAEGASEVKNVGKVVNGICKKSEKSKNSVIAPEQKKDRKELTKIAKVNATSGSWTVTPLKEDKPKPENKKKRNSSLNIEELFEDLNEKIAKETERKLRKFQKISSSKTKTKESKGDSEEDVDLSMAKSRIRPELDVGLLESAGREEALGEVAQALPPVQESEAPAEIDPKKFIEVKPKKLPTVLPDDASGDEDFLDDEENAQRMNIVEAFAADDVIEEFQEMKRQEEDNTKLEVPDQLPGWGSWGGAGVKRARTKTRYLDTSKLPQRKDKNKKDMIISEKASNKAVEHMVKEVPHPFKSVGAFESNIRNPVGREWVPESAHRKYIKKPVETRLGTIIAPMDENELIQLKKQTKSLYKGKTKQA